MELQEPVNILVEAAPEIEFERLRSTGCTQEQMSAKHWHLKMNFLFFSSLCVTVTLSITLFLLQIFVRCRRRGEIMPN